MIMYIALLTSSLLHSGDLTELLYNDSSDDSWSETEEGEKPQKLIFTDILPDGMWGTRDCPVEKYRHHSEQLTKLTEYEVINFFWSKMRDAPQEKRDNLLLEVATTYIGGDPFYLAKRKNIAAAVLIGANLIKIEPILRQNYWNLLYDSVLQNDLSLTRLLLTHNHPYSSSPFGEQSILFHTERVDIAKLLEAVFIKI